MPAMSPASPSPSRLRRHVATLVLVVASLGTVATSESNPTVTTDLAVPTLRLTQEAPRSTRHFVIRVSAKDSDAFASTSVDVNLAVRWKPAQDGSASAPPPLRFKLSAGTEWCEQPQTLNFDPNEPERTKNATASCAFDCSLKDGCVQEVALDIEATGELGAGAVEVDWHLFALASTNEPDEPKDFTVRIEEP